MNQREQTDFAGMDMTGPWIFHAQFLTLSFTNVDTKCDGKCQPLLTLWAIWLVSFLYYLYYERCQAE